MGSKASILLQDSEIDEIKRDTGCKLSTVLSPYFLRSNAQVLINLHFVSIFNEKQNVSYKAFYIKIAI